ncbi:MAG: dTMP kinase [Candidatus Bathyarchaeia archaeon]
MNKQGFFICIEGLDGSGKTTQAKILVKNLIKQGYTALYTAEPSNGKIGKFIRRYLHGERRFSGIIEALLFAADRFEHVSEEIRPALDEGKIVVSDRYVYSSMAYQGASGIDVDWIKMINKYVLKPDLAIFIDVAPEVVLQRIRRKRTIMEDLKTQRMVREVYMKLVESGELKRVDGNKPKEDLAGEILSICLDALKMRLYVTPF